MLVGAALQLDPLWVHRELLAAIVGGLIMAEMAYMAWARGRSPSIAQTANDSVIFAVNLAERGATVALRFGLFAWLARFAPVRWEVGIGSAAAAYVLIDFIYYWKHRLFHQTRLGWALHSTHHSSESLNFLATFRLNWIEAALSYLFFAPLALLGFDPWLLLMLIEINDGWQMVCHTELPSPSRWLDRWFNTPNNHRVHHARDTALHDRNYGSTLMLWDQLFGTYLPGRAQVECGLPDRRLGNLLSIQFGPLWSLIRGASRRNQPPSPGSTAARTSKARA
ncbi:MAG: sterol desaturase family protein [Myxococcota bacterium]